MRDYINDWDLKVGYENKFPTKIDIEKDYAQLPITENSFVNTNFNYLNHQTIAQLIFELMNHYETNPMSSVDLQEWIKQNKVSHTSMSVGDIVIIDDKIYVCANEGWEEVKQ